MELYLSACSKPANTAAKTATSSLTMDSQLCGDGAQKTHFPTVGAAQLLDLPLGVKLPVIPGSNTVFYTTRLSEKLFRPSYDFNLTDPYCRLLETQYKSLHDPHLKDYYKRKDILRKLKKGGYITNDNKIICSLREWNKYRQYLTSLKLDFERSYLREQEMLAKRVNKFQESNHFPEVFDISQFRKWLLQESPQSIKDQELLRHRYMDMIRRELDLLERTAEEQRLIQKDKEERQQREQTRRKLNLRRKIEEEWKEKEMLLLTRIGEDVKREARIEEQRRKNREESDRKKQALLEKKMAYHLQKMQDIGNRREEMRKNMFEGKGQNATSDSKNTERQSFTSKKKRRGDGTTYPANKGANGLATNNVQSNSLNPVQKMTTSGFNQVDIQDNSKEKKNDVVITRKSSHCDDEGVINISDQDSLTSDQTLPTKKLSSISDSYINLLKEEAACNCAFTSNTNRRNEVQHMIGIGPYVNTTKKDISSPTLSNTKDNLVQNCLSNKVTTEELNSIFHNIMTWVVATVTSILYPAITKYEERLRNNMYSVSDESVLSSESSSFCSTCSDEVTYGSYTSTNKTFQTEAYTLASDIPVKQPAKPLNLPTTPKEKILMEKVSHTKRPSMLSDLKHDKSRRLYTYPKVRSCKSDSQLLTSETSTKISKDATTETDSLGVSLSSDQNSKVLNELKNLKNVFVNFKCHLKGETELILRSIFEEIMSDLTQAIPSLSSVTAEVFVDQCEADKKKLGPYVDISSVATEIVENMLEKLQSAVEKKCMEAFSQEDVSVHSKPDPTPDDKYLTSSHELQEASPPYTLEPMRDIAEDMVHTILEKLMTLASCRQKEPPQREDKTKPIYQQYLADPTFTYLQKVEHKNSRTELDTANLTLKEEIKNLISSIFSRSSLVRYIEEIINIILGCVQSELNSERLVASEETVLLLQVLDDIFSQLHRESVKPTVKKNKQSRLRNPSNTDDKYRLTSTRVSNGRRSGRRFSPVNVPGMVLYSEDDSEEIDTIVKNVLDSSFKDERAKLQEKMINRSFTKENTCFEYETNIKTPTKTSSQYKVACGDRGSFFDNKDLLKDKHYLNEDIFIFSQEQKQEIQKISEKLVKSILIDMIKDIPSLPPDDLDGKNGNETSSAGKCRALLDQDRMYQLFSMSEIRTVAQELTDSVINILLKASSHITNTTKDRISSSVRQTSLDYSDTLHMAKKAPNKKSLKIWFDSEKKMKHLSSLNIGPSQPSFLESGKDDPESLEDINDKIINTVFKALKLLVCPKLQERFKPSLTKQSSLRSQLSAYTTKVVNIVLNAIQNELEHQKNLNLSERDFTKTFTAENVFADPGKKSQSLVTNLSDDSSASPLVTYICNLLSSQNEDHSDVPHPADKSRPETSFRSYRVDKQNILSHSQDKKSPTEFHKCLGSPCILHSVIAGKDLKENVRLQVLDTIGELLYEMLCKFIGVNVHSHDSACINREKTDETQQKATDLKSNIQLISKTILEYIIAKLCGIETDSSPQSSGYKTVSRNLDIDSLSFASLLEEIAKCTDIISSLVSGTIQKGTNEMSSSVAKNTNSLASTPRRVRETHPKKLKAVASDILNMVFDKLESFANGNLETLETVNDGNKKINKMACGCESTSAFTDTHEEPLQSALYTHAKKLSSALLKAIQNELNVSSSDFRASVKSPPPEKQIITDTVNLILDAVSLDIFKDTECEERGIERYRYRPTYGNLLPGGGESDSLEDAVHEEKEFTEAEPLPVEEMKSDPLKQWALEKVLNKIEVHLKEPEKSPIMPIIKNILNEIFQNAFVNQLNMLPLPHSDLSSILHKVDEPVAQNSVQLLDTMTGPIVSEADVSIVTDDVVRIVFHKLCSAAMSEKNAGKSRYKTITFSANVSFHEHTNGGKSCKTALDRDLCTLQSGTSVDKEVTVNVVEDIIQTVLTNLETFTTSKVKSLFGPHVSFTVPLTSPLQEDKCELNTVLSNKDSYSDDKLVSLSVDHIKSIQTNSTCQLPLSKLDNYATEVARKILQGIKHKLDTEIQSPFITHNVVISEQIASQVVSMVLDIVSSKGKCEKVGSNKDTRSDQQESIIEKLLNKIDYRKALQFQIQDTIENILCDIYEKTLDQNKLSRTISTVNCNTDGKHSEMIIESSNKVTKRLTVPKSDVVMISNDAVDIVLSNLNSTLTLVINAKDSISSRLSLTVDDWLPKAQKPIVMDSKSEQKIESLPLSANLQSSYPADKQISVVEKEESKKYIPDPCEENANFITKTIFNRLESFATERIDALITLAFQPKEKISANPGLENGKPDGKIFNELSQVESGGPMNNEMFTHSTLTSYREKVVSTIHLSQTSLKEYADIIASAILKLIKNDLDLQVQRMCPYSNNMPVQENIIVNGVVSSILQILYDKRSEKEISFYSKQKTNLFSQLTVSDDKTLGEKKKENNTEPSPPSNDPLEKQEVTSEKETQRMVLEEIFMRNKEERKKEKSALINAVEEVLNKVHQRVMNIMSHLSPLNETPNSLSNSKIKASDLTQRSCPQLHINCVAADIVEDVLEKMYSVIVKYLNESTKRGKVEAAVNNDAPPMKPSCSKITKQAGKGSETPMHLTPPVNPCTSSQHVSSKENLVGQYYPLQVGKELVQMVLQKIKNFASLPLENTSPNSSPKAGLKANLKVRSKSTTVPKFRTKQQLGPNGAKTKNKTKFYSGETSPRFSRSKAATIGLPHILSTGDAKSILEIKLPISELKLYSKDIVSNILETVMNELENMKQNQVIASINASSSDEVMAASEVVNRVLQEISDTTHHNLTYPNKFTYLNDPKFSQGNLGIESLAKPQACFFLENVSSQLEQIFPKEGVFIKMFEKWQTESNDMDNEKHKLLMIAQNGLTEISIKAKELEYSLSLLNLTSLETCESRFCSPKGAASTRAVDSKAQINVFGREIIEMLFEKLQMCFLTQISIKDGKETVANRKEGISVKTKYSSAATHNLGTVAVSNTTSKDTISLGSSNQIVQEIIDRVLNMLESFVDLQFKHISKYEFSEIVKMPIESFYPVQQRLLSKKMLPKLQPIKKSSDETKSYNSISKENIENTFLQVHAFHSELLTYSTNIVSDMLGIIKGELDKEISQGESSVINSSKENVVASEIIGTLIDQCSNFGESLIDNLPKESLFQEDEKVCLVNQVKVTSNMKKPTSKLKETSTVNSPPQVSVPGLVLCSRENIKDKYKKGSSSNVRYVGGISTQEQMEISDLESTRLDYRNKIRNRSSRNINYDNFDQDIQGNNCAPEGSMLQKLFKKANESTETALKQAMSFIEMGKDHNPRVFHYENQPSLEAAQIQTTVSPLKICLAAENIVNTVLTSYGFPNQSHTNERMETMKPIFISEQIPLSVIPEKEEEEETVSLGTWDKKFHCTEKEEHKNPEVSEMFSLLQRWNVKCPERKKIETLEEVEVIAFADHEIGPKEIHLVARHITTTVLTHLKNFEPQDSHEEMLSIASTLPRRKYELKQPLRSIHNDSSLNQFYEHLTELVIYYIFSSVFDGSKEDKERMKALENQDIAVNKLVLIHSQVFESRTIPTGELALCISEIIIRILSNSNIIKTDFAQQMTTVKTKYIYCPSNAATDLDDVFHDLLIGVIHILSKEMGINHRLENKGRNNSCSVLRNQRAPICDKTDAMESPIDPRVSELSTHKVNQLIQKNKLNYLACKLDKLVDNLKNHESKETVNKVFNIVLDVFLPDEYPDVSVNSGKLSRTFLPFSNNHEECGTCGNNLGLSPKSVFLLNVICEKLTRTLLEKCTSIGCFDNNDLLCDEKAEEYQLLKIFQNVEDEEFDCCRGALDCQPFQGDCMSELLENLAEMDQEVLSSDSMLTIISHILVKSLMEKLSQCIQHTFESPLFENNHSKQRTMKKHSSFRKVKSPECTELQDKDSLDNSKTYRSKIHTAFGKQSSVKSNVSPFKRQGTKDTDTTAVNNMFCPGGKIMTVYSATFLEDIISELFFNLSTSLWGKNGNITELWLHEINTLFIKSVVDEFNNAQVTVLRNAEERLYFSLVHKETVSNIVDSVYNDVLQHYKLNATPGNTVAHGSTSIAEQITNGILLEILDFQLPSYLREKLLPNSCYPLSAEIILQKLQSNLREFTSQHRFSTGYSTKLSYSFLEDVIRRLLSQLSPPSSESSSLGRKYLVSSNFNEISTCIINKVMSAISKHNIFFTLYDNQYVYTRENLQKMVDSVYRNILQMSDSLVSIQKSIVSQNPIITDQIASFIIQEIIENHLQPFLCGESLLYPKTPLDEISKMVKHVLSDVTEPQRVSKPSSLSVYPDTFVGEIVTRLLSKIFIPKSHTEFELEKITQKLVNSINNYFDKAKINTIYDNMEHSVDKDIVDKLVTSVYKNVLKQHELYPEVIKESKDSDIFVENITNLIVAAISDYLLHPLFSGDVSDTSSSSSAAENIVQDILGNINKCNQPNQSLSPYNTLLSYTFLEDMIRVLLSKIFPSTSSLLPNREFRKDRPEVNFNEMASKLISDIRAKISQHEIRFSKKEEETQSVYSEDDVQHLVDSVFTNILQNFGPQESIEQNITDSNDTLIDRIAGFIIKNICQKHLQPFVDRKSLTSSSCSYFHDESSQLFYASVYSSTFLEDVVSGVLSKIFHRLLGIVQTKSVKSSEDELLEIAKKLIPLITEEFSKAHVSIIENAEYKLSLPPIERERVIKTIDMIYSKFLQDYEMEIMPSKDFLNNTKTLAARVTKIILTEIFDFQIHPDFVAKLPFKSQSKLSADVLIKRVERDISKSRLRRQPSTTYTTILSHAHLEKIVTQLLSQISPLVSTKEDPDDTRSELSNTVMQLINEIVSIISKHAICIVKHGSEKQSMISEKDIQSMVDSIYVDLSCSDLYQSLTKEKKGISNVPISKIASFIIKEIFNHHLQSFLSGDQTLISAAVDQTYEERAIDSKERELALIVNSAVFLEEVISKLLCKILYAFSHSVFVAENPDKAKDKIIGLVTTVVKSIVLEFATSEILLADNINENLCFSEGYEEIVQNTVNLIYEKILDEYKSLIQVYKVVQSDPTGFGRKIYGLLLGEIYDYQVQSLVSGKLVYSSYSSLRTDNIIRKVLDTIIQDKHPLPSCMTVLPRSLLEDIIYKLLHHISPLTDLKKDKEVKSDHEFVDAVSKLTDEIITEISEHEIRLATAENNTVSMQVEEIDNFVDSICNNIWKKSEFQAEVQKGGHKKRGSFLSKIAGLIMKEIMDQHLKPFLHSEESAPSDLSDDADVSVLDEPDKEKTQPSLYSATFLEDVIVDLVRKFYSLPSAAGESKKKEMAKPDIISLAIEFVNSLLKEFRKSEIKVLPKAEEIFSFPPIDKETVDKITNFVYDQFIVKCGPNDLQNGENSNILIEMVSSLAQDAISAFKIQPLFSGDWSSIFFSFLNPDNITQRIQHLPQETSIQVNRSLKESQGTLPEESNKHITLGTGQKKTIGTLQNNRDIRCRKKSLNKEETSLKKQQPFDPLLSVITSIMKSSIVNQAVVPPKKKKSESKMETEILKYVNNIPEVTPQPSRIESDEIQHSGLNVALEINEIKKKSLSTLKHKEGQEEEVYEHFSVVNKVKKCEKIPTPSFETDDEKKREKSLENVDQPVKVSTLTSNASSNTRDTSSQTVNEEEHESIQYVTENICENVLDISFQDSAGDSKFESPFIEQALHVIQGVNKDYIESISAKNVSPSTKNRVPTQVMEESRAQEIKSASVKPNSSHYSLETKPGIFPANFLEDIVIEMINKLIFSSPPERQKGESSKKVTDNKSQAELYDTAMKLIDSLLKEFSNAQIKVFRPDQGNKFFQPADKVSSGTKVSPKQKEPISDEAPFNLKIIVDKTPLLQKMNEKSFSYEVPSLKKMPSFDKTLVNKVVHSSVCSILKEYKSQDSICKNINTNRESLARRLTSAVINEIFQHQLDLIFGDDVTASACLPLQTKDIAQKIQKVAQTASKECQTSSPYTILLPHKFLENMISSLLSRILFTVTSVKAETSTNSLSADLDFLKMRLVHTILAKISKDEDMAIQYVEPLHPNDNGIIQLVVQSIYNDLLSQFGSQEIMQSCVTGGCRILSETIVDLVLREVSGNQLQKYFSGELTPHQCAEIDSVVENILKKVIQTTDVPPPQPSHVHKLSYSIVEEIAVKFLTKLLSMFPKLTKGASKTLEIEIEKIISKILDSVQRFLSKSKIKLLPDANKSCPVPLSDNATIENIVDSIYTSILKNFGSHTSIFKDLVGKSNVLSDIIGFLMVKEISNSEFQPQKEEEVSTSELALEAVEIMGKVIKIISELKSQEKSLSRKCFLLNATLLEEILALFLAKLVRLPSNSLKKKKKLTTFEISRIASQLVKYITDGISDSNISLVVATDPGETILNPESMEIVSQVVDSVYSDILQQSGTQENLYSDINDTDSQRFPKMVSSLIINSISNTSLNKISSKYVSVPAGDLDTDRIVLKAQEHAAIIAFGLEKEECGKISTERKFPLKIVPYIGNKPINIDPTIISEHLAVISVKTQPLEKLNMDCFEKTGHSLAELRNASVSGKSYSSSDIPGGERRRKERRISLNQAGQLDLKPFEAVCRNSFQNIRKPDLTKVELLKDVQNKYDLITRLVTHDIDQTSIEDNTTDEGQTSDEDEIILGDIVQTEFLGENAEAQVKAEKPVESKVTSPNPTSSTNSLKKFLSLSKCCQLTSSINAPGIEVSANQATESAMEEHIKRTDAELDMATYLVPSAETNCFLDKTAQQIKEDKKNINEPTQYLIHRIMSSSSYNQEDLLSPYSEIEDTVPNPNIKILQEMSKTSVSKQGSKMLAKVSSAISKVFSRSNTNISKSSSPSYMKEP
ncbi:PREDICTED: fibrous sheath-interacting protein 2-like [Elephantulus edwardii]|uniref:fibrous sheath-interacting protein 2-like n=1 Tax=Elephantulus edwardii TaxID=28737 RepID=UPI0003F0B1BE|nr:PREDICTED: fibrous sheath-interacting protein 2-like [Elephantulus edwardii]